MSEVKCQGYDLTECCRGMHFNDVALRLTCLIPHVLISEGDVVLLILLNPRLAAYLYVCR